MRWSRREWMKRHVFTIFFLSILTVLILVGVYVVIFGIGEEGKEQMKIINSATANSAVENTAEQTFMTSVDAAPERRIESTGIQSSAVLKNSTTCGMHTCFDIYRCGKLGENKLSVYLYPVQRIFVNGRLLQESISREFYEIIEAILRSPYFVTDPTLACIFVPTIDLLNIQPFLAPSGSDSSVTKMNDLSLALHNLEL